MKGVRRVRQVPFRRDDLLSELNPVRVSRNETCFALYQAGCNSSAGSKLPTPVPPAAGQSLATHWDGTTLMGGRLRPPRLPRWSPPHEPERCHNPPPCRGARRRRPAGTRPAARHAAEGVLWLQPGRRLLPEQLQTARRLL